MGWGKIGTLCSLKAIALACLLTPATTILPTTPAFAQFTIVIPGFGGLRYHGRRYGRRHGRYARRGRHNGAEPGEVSTPPSNSPPTGSAAVTPIPTGSGNKKMRGTSDD